MAEEYSVKEEGGPGVDYMTLVDENPTGLCEAKSPSVMNNICKSLPSHGLQLKWIQGQPLVPKILLNVSTLFPLVTALVLKRNV